MQAYCCYFKRMCFTRVLKSALTCCGAAETTGDARAMIRANAGGPYGSAVLKGVEADSNAVWQQISSGAAGDVGMSWYKARLKITAAPQVSHPHCPFKLCKRLS